MKDLRIRTIAVAACPAGEKWQQRVASVAIYVHVVAATHVLCIQGTCHLCLRRGRWPDVEQGSGVAMAR